VLNHLVVVMVGGLSLISPHQLLYKGLWIKIKDSFTPTKRLNYLQILGSYRH